MPIVKTVALLVVLVAIAIGGRLWMMGNDASQPQATQQTIGGPFTLVNGQGETVTDQQFRGKYMLVYFGYTFCPDVCPTALQVMAQALDQLPPETAAKITPIFISIDPERDTPEHVGQYVTHFYPTLIGLTGSPEQVKAAAAAYRIYYAKVEEKGADPSAYLMDHSAILYLMGPDGSFLSHFGHDTTSDTMALRLKKLVQ
jgi:protein SCO1/2